MGQYREIVAQSAAEPRSDTDPCVGCGMCCDGTMYSMGKAEPGEESRIAAHGLSLIEHDGQRYFSMPCRHSCEGRCAIYEERFAKCRSYKCKLLKEYQLGGTSPEAAHEIVQTALELRSDALAAHPDAGLSTDRTRLRSEFGRSKDHRDLVLRMAALDYYLDVHFRNKELQVTPEQRA